MNAFNESCSPNLIFKLEFWFQEDWVIFGLKIDFEIWKCPIFASSASNCLTRYEQILSVCSLGSKNALNFTCLTMKFQNCHHTNLHIGCDIQLASIQHDTFPMPGPLSKKWIHTAQNCVTDRGRKQTHVRGGHCENYFFVEPQANWKSKTKF